MAETGKIRTFIGSNSGKGHESFKNTLYDAGNMNTVILLKGGAGNGKSTLMEKLARAAEMSKDTVERVYCPSDPGSLDAIVCRGKGFAVLDATPPHAFEAELHCLPEIYLSLSSYIDGGISSRREAVREISGELCRVRAQADRALRAAYEADSELCGEVLTYADTGVLSSIGAGLAGDLAGRAEEGEKGFRPMRRRFITAVAPDETVTFSETPFALLEGKSPETVAVRDRFGLSPFLLGAAADEAQRHGCEVWGFFDPLVPARLNGLVIPKTGLCILPEELVEKADRTVDTGECLSEQSMAQLGARPEVLLAVKKALLDEAEARLGECLDIHAGLEAEYREFTDFAGLDALALELAAEYIL